MKIRRRKSSHKKKLVQWFLFLIIISLSLYFGSNYERDLETGRGVLEVHFIDVGQADSALVQSPEGSVILIDGGNNDDGELVVSYLLDQGINKLDAIIATHPHADHIGGLDTVLKVIPTDVVYMPKAVTSTRTYEDFIDAVNASGATKIQAKAGVDLDIPGFKGKFLAPANTDYDDLNNYSAVLKLVHEETSFLFTGDAEQLSEEEMIKNGNLSSTVLKVGHHGSSTSTSQKFLDAVSPSYGIISSGKNNEYGHPHKEVLKRLNHAGVEILRTDENGTIVLKSDGHSITVQ